MMNWKVDEKPGFTPIVTNGVHEIFVRGPAEVRMAEEVCALLNNEDPQAELKLQAAVLGDFTISFRVGGFDIALTAPTIEDVVELASRWSEKHDKAPASKGSYDWEWWAKGTSKTLEPAWDYIQANQAQFNALLGDDKTKILVDFFLKTVSESVWAKLETEELEEAVRYRNEEIERLQAENTALRNSLNLEQMQVEKLTERVISQGKRLNYLEFWVKPKKVDHSELASLLLETATKLEGRIWTSATDAMRAAAKALGAQ